MKRPLYAKYKIDNTSCGKFAIRANVAMFVGNEALEIKARASTAPNPKLKTSDVLVAATKLISRTAQMIRPRTMPMAIVNLHEC